MRRLAMPLVRVVALLIPRLQIDPKCYTSLCPEGIAG